MTLRQEIEKILETQVEWEKVVTAIEELFEKRIEPLNKIMKKYHPEGVNLVLHTQAEKDLWNAIKQTVGGDK
jgi:hypothetical protein